MQTIMKEGRYEAEIKNVEVFGQILTGAIIILAPQEEAGKTINFYVQLTNPIKNEGIATIRRNNGRPRT